MWQEWFAWKPLNAAHLFSNDSTSDSLEKSFCMRAALSTWLYLFIMKPCSALANRSLLWAQPAGDYQFISPFTPLWGKPEFHSSYETDGFFFFLLCKERDGGRNQKTLNHRTYWGIYAPDGVWKTGFVTLDIVKVESKNKEKERRIRLQ